MSGSAEDFPARWKGSIQKIRTAAPEVGRAFGRLHAAVMKPVSRAVRGQELIAMTGGLSRGCTECTYLRAVGAVKVGAIGDQVVGAAGVAVLMVGGRPLVLPPVLLETLCCLQTEQHPQP